jgi:hypothetical protein
MDESMHINFYKFEEQPSIRINDDDNEDSRNDQIVEHESCSQSFPKT